jgi:hypothetical protein
MKRVSTFIAATALSLFAIGCTETIPSESSGQLMPDSGRQLVMDSIQAHGGTEKWYNNGLLQYRWKHYRSDKGPGNISETIQTVDPRSLDVVHEVPGQGIRFGYSQGQYWIAPEGAQFSPPVKFWALTPYYFIGIPFVFNDETHALNSSRRPKSLRGRPTLKSKSLIQRKPETHLTIITCFSSILRRS